MHDLNNIWAIAHRYNKRLVINTMLYKAIRGAASDVEECRLNRLERKQLEIAHDIYFNKTQQEFDNLNVSDAYHYDHFPPELIPCSASKSSYWISWDGKMLPCGIFAYPFTRPLEEGFLQAWNILPSLLNNIDQPHECKTCNTKDSCNVCPARLQAETGSFTTLAGYVCGKMSEGFE